MEGCKQIQNGICDYKTLQDPLKQRSNQKCNKQKYAQQIVAQWLEWKPRNHPEQNCENFQAIAQPKIVIAQLPRSPIN